MIDRHQRRVKTLTIAGRFIGLGTALLFLLFAIGEASISARVEGLKAINLGLVLIMAPAVIALAGCILSWWWLLPAGAILLFVYLFQGIDPLLYSLYSGKGAIFEPFWWFAGLPFLVAGLLFLASWLLSKKASHN